MATISLAIITKNEEENIARCIQSVAGLADEIIVVDSNSTDQTTTIAQELGAKVVLQSFLGYIEQKNFALEQCTCDYILSLDADEALSEDLRKALIALKPKLEAAAYSFNRITNIGETWIKHSGWYPDKKLRLFKRNAGAWGGTNPHDTFLLKGNQKPKHLGFDILHYSFKDLEDHRQQSMRFAEISAKSLLAQGKSSNLAKSIIKAIGAFVKCFLVKGGIWHPKLGWPIAGIAAKSKFLKYQRLAELSRSLDK